MQSCLKRTACLFKENCISSYLPSAFGGFSTCFQKYMADLRVLKKYLPSKKCRVLFVVLLVFLFFFSFFSRRMPNKISFCQQNVLVTENLTLQLIFIFLIGLLFQNRKLMLMQIMAKYQPVQGISAHRYKNKIGIKTGNQTERRSLNTVHRFEIK